MSTNGGPEALADHVKRRRDELDLTQMEVWQAGGPSNTTLTVIENSHMHDLTRATARKLDRGLQWEPGSAMAVWRGKSPTPVSKGDPSLLELDDDGAVGATTQDVLLPDYVESPGDRDEGGLNEDLVLRKLDQMQEDIRALSEWLEQRRQDRDA